MHFTTEELNRFRVAYYKQTGIHLDDADTRTLAEGLIALYGLAHRTTTPESGGSSPVPIDAEPVDS